MPSFWVGATELRVGAPSAPPDAEIYEEDTHLVLSAPPEVPEESDPPIKVMTAVWNAEPRTPGTVLRRGRRLLAIIHALEAEPTTQLAWVEQAWRAALTLARAQGWSQVSGPLLGTVHGRLPLPEAVQALLAGAWQAGGAAPLVLWLRVPAGRRAQIRGLLETRGQAAGP